MTTHQISVSSLTIWDRCSQTYAYKYRSLCVCGWRDRRIFSLDMQGHAMAAVRGEQHQQHQADVARITAPKAGD